MARATPPLTLATRRPKPSLRQGRWHTQATALALRIAFFISSLAVDKRRLPILCILFTRPCPKEKKNLPSLSVLGSPREVPTQVRDHDVSHRFSNIVDFSTRETLEALDEIVLSYRLLESVVSSKHNIIGVNPPLDPAYTFTTWDPRDTQHPSSEQQESSKSLRTVDHSLNSIGSPQRFESASSTNPKLSGLASINLARSITSVFAERTVAPTNLAFDSG